MTNHSLVDEPSLFSTLTGLIPFNIINTINEYIDSSKLSSTLAIKFLLHLNQQIHKHIWIPYCISRANNQSQLNLTNPTNNHPNSSNSQPILTKMSTKLTAWYPSWIKYQVPLTNIIHNNQI
jgi:hypothetical protein